MSATATPRFLPHPTTTPSPARLAAGFTIPPRFPRESGAPLHPRQATPTSPPCCAPSALSVSTTSLLRTCPSTSAHDRPAARAGTNSSYDAPSSTALPALAASNAARRLPSSATACRAYRRPAHRCRSREHPQPHHRLYALSARTQPGQPSSRIGFTNASSPSSLALRLSTPPSTTAPGRLFRKPVLLRPCASPKGPMPTPSLSPKSPLSFRHRGPANPRCPDTTLRVRRKPFGRFDLRPPGHWHSTPRPSVPPPQRSRPFGRRASPPSRLPPNQQPRPA